MSVHSVRQAEEADLEFLSKHNSWESERVRRKAANEEFFVCEAGGAVVGFVRIGFLWSDFPFIELILVPEERNRRVGAGKAMLAFLENRFRGTSPYLYSSCVSSEGEPQAWHRRHGFEDCGYLYQLDWGAEGEIFFRKPV